MTRELTLSELLLLRELLAREKRQCGELVAAAAMERRTSIADAYKARRAECDVIDAMLAEPGQHWLKYRVPEPKGNG